MDEEQLKEYQERMKARWAQNAGADGDDGGAESGPSTDTGTILPLPSLSRKENTMEMPRQADMLNVISGWRISGA